MKYTSDEAMERILRRGREIRSERDRRTTRILGGVSAALFTALIAVLVMMPGKSHAEAGSSVFGAFLLPSEAGGYVIAAVIAFALGIVITILAIRYRNNRRNGDKPKEDGEEER